MKLILLNRGEEYTISMPYANCKGILIGKLTMELGGKVSIECAKTGYSTEIEFKLKPLLGGLEASNLIDGKIKFAKETIATISGKWDGEIVLNEKRDTQKQCLLWNPSKQIIESRLKRYIVPIENQKEFEAEKLWAKVSDAIKKCDQHLATDEKSVIETKQRENYADRKLKNVEYTPSLFTYDNDSKQWIYNYSDLRPWDPQTDMFQYESNFKITTKTKHNLSKLKSNQLITSPRINSMISISHNGSKNRFRQVSSTENIDTVSNKSAHHSNNNQNNENSFDILMQYTDIKQRLNGIEDNLQKITSLISSSDENKSIEPTRNDKFIDLSLSRSKVDNLRSFFTSTNLLVAVIAWIIGLISAVVSSKLFKASVR